ncbi:response regulator [Pseudodesulfovibrio sp.]|nr:response regulator [Pseudodesulfovibrio sp.]
MSQSQYSILVVDDSQEYLNMVSHYLAELPCSVTLASDGKEGVELFSEGDFDLVIMDIIMPGMDGVEAMETIRKLETQWSSPPVPILSLSIESSVETAVQCINAGATRMIIKPVSQRGLHDAVCELLDIDHHL